MDLSCCVWAMNYGKRRWSRFFRRRLDKVVSETDMLDWMAKLGFQHVDIQPNMQHSEASKETLKKYQQQVACMSLSFFGPEGGSFHSSDSTAAHSLMSHLKKGIDHTSKLGVDLAYVVPGKSSEGFSLTDSAPYYFELADHAQSKGVKIGIEHFPATALPTIQSTLEFLELVKHPNLYLLFDIGHAQISQEDPAEVLPDAGDRLLYVHLDDNDGKEDLHLALTEGIQSHQDLETLFNTLDHMRYSGPVSLELHPLLQNPFQALRDSKALVEGIYDFP